MKQAGLITNPSRGIYKITKRGKDVLASAPSELSVDYLMRFPEFVEFRTRAKKTDGEETTSITNLDESKTPKEHLEDGYQKLRGELVSEILVTIKSCSPDFFENLVVELLIKMGYGGSRKDAGRAIGKSGDGGIDGIINEDRLGLDIIYIQAKRWESTVGRPEIQKFVGALHGKRARKGVFITTANYSKEAADYVAGIDSKVVLIDGEHLAQLMIDFDLGVSKVASYEIKKIDSDYFVE